MIKIIKKKINMSDELKTKIEYLKLQNTTLKKYIPTIENDKDNAN